MCLILAGSSSLTSLVREAATKRSLRPRQPIHAGEEIAHGEHARLLRRLEEQKPHVGTFFFFSKGAKYRGLTDGGCGSYIREDLKRN